MGERTQRSVCVLLLVAVVFLLYWPVLGMEMIGDDYQWVQHARRALQRPGLLLVDLDTFYRPASTLTLAADQLVWGGRPVGFRLTNLLLHAACAALLVVTGRRLGLSDLGAGCVGLLWAASPFASEPASQVAIRFESLLLASWLGIIAVWPREGWRQGRRAAVGGLTASAMLSKETWVVTPVLAWVLEVVVRRRPPRAAVRSVLPFVAAAGTYVATYFWVFPGDKGYYRASLATLAKLPHQMAAFLHLEELVPLQFPFSWRTAVAIAAILGLATLAILWRSPAGVVGLTLLVIPSLPTLLVPYLPTRHTAAPYAGFLLLVAGVVGAWLPRIEHRRWQRVAVAVTSALVALVLAADATTVRADLEDVGRVAAAHARLLGEARDAAQRFPLGVPVVHVRAESESPLREIAASPRGLLKLHYPRHQDPYGLVDTAALFDFVLADKAIDVQVLSEDDPRLEDPGLLLVHRAGGFEWVPTDRTAGQLLRAVRAQGHHARALLGVGRR